MRNFKFRGKMKVRNKWIYGDIAHVQGELCIQTDVSEENKHTIGWNVIPESIGQFTGLRDKNGKEIYEGDIIQTNDSEGNQILHEVYYLESEARFATKLIGYENLNEGSLTQKWINELDFEVIGNIFDNPELLKEK